MGGSRVLRLVQGRPGTMHRTVGTFMTLRHQNAPSTPSTRIPKYSVNYFRNPYCHYHLHCLRFSHFLSEQSQMSVVFLSVSGLSLKYIPSCRVNAISRRGIVQLGSSLSCSILLFPLRVPGAHA